MKKIFFIGALVALVLVGNAFGQDAKKEYGVKIGGQIFARWQWNASNTSTSTPAKDVNAFDVERFYLTAKGDLSEEVSVNGTIDLYNTGTANQAAMMQAKNAFLDWKFAPDFFLRAGLQPQQWVDFEYSLWGYRGIDKTALDNAGYIATADWGLGLNYNLPSKLGLVSATLVNGKGFRTVEDNRFKDLSVNLNLTPFSGQDGVLKGLKVGAGYYAGNTGEGVGRSRIGFGVGLPTDYVRIGFMYDMYSDDAKATTGTITATKGNSMSAVAEVLGGGFTPDLKQLSLLFKFDAISPNADVATLDYSKIVLGLVYKPTKNLYISLNDQIVTYKDTKTVTILDANGVQQSTVTLQHFNQYGGANQISDPKTKATYFDKTVAAESKIFLQMIVNF